MAKGRRNTNAAICGVCRRDFIDKQSSKSTAAAEKDRFPTFVSHVCPPCAKTYAKIHKKQTFSEKVNRFIKKKRVKPLKKGEEPKEPKAVKVKHKKHNASKNVVPPNVLVELHNNKSERLAFTYYKFGAKGTEALSAQLYVNLSLTELDLSRNSLRNKGAELIGDALCANKSVRHLNLSYNGIAAKGCEKIAEMLVVNTYLWTLVLDHNHIGNHGAQVLAIGLGKNATLKSLQLSNARIGEVGAKALGIALEQPACRLPTLNLSHNMLHDKGARDLATSLASCTTLTDLNLEYNGIRIDGGNALTDALFENTHLTSLLVFTNMVGDYAGWHIPRYLKENRQFVVLRRHHALLRQQKTAFIMGLHARTGATSPLSNVTAKSPLFEPHLVQEILAHAFDAEVELVHTYVQMPVSLFGQWGGHGGQHREEDADLVAEYKRLHPKPPKKKEEDKKPVKKKEEPAWANTGPDKKKKKKKKKKATWSLPPPDSAPPPRSSTAFSQYSQMEKSQRDFFNPIYSADCSLTSLIEPRSHDERFRLRYAAQKQKELDDAAAEKLAASLPPIDQKRGGR